MWQISEATQGAHIVLYSTREGLKNESHVPQESMWKQMQRNKNILCILLEHRAQKAKNNGKRNLRNFANIGEISNALSNKSYIMENSTEIVSRIEGFFTLFINSLQLCSYYMHWMIFFLLYLLKQVFLPRSALQSFSNVSLRWILE